MVIPCRNEARFIGALLDALAGQTRLPSEIVIVDDRSTDDSVAVIQRWQRDHPGLVVRIVGGPGRGPGPAMNCGVAASTSEVVVRLDGHSVPGPGYVEYSVSGLAAPRTGVVGGYWHVRPGAETAVGRAIARVVSHPLGSGGARYRHPVSKGPMTVPVETVPFGAFRRTLWEQLGGFDEALAANQDFDFNYRARAAGFDVVLDRRINAVYVARPTLAALWRQYVRYGFWKQQMLRKDARAWEWRQLPPVMLLPWLLVTTVHAAAWATTWNIVVASLYPTVLVIGAADLARRRTNPVAALAGLAIVHLSWSVGFWRGVFGGRAPTH